MGGQHLIGYEPGTEPGITPKLVQIPLPNQISGSNQTQINLDNKQT